MKEIEAEGTAEAPAVSVTEKLVYVSLPEPHWSDLVCEMEKQSLAMMMISG